MTSIEMLEHELNRLTRAHDLYWNKRDEAVDRRDHDAEVHYNDKMALVYERRDGMIDAIEIMGYKVAEVMIEKDGKREWRFTVTEG